MTGQKDKIQNRRAVNRRCDRFEPIAKWRDLCFTIKLMLRAIVAISMMLGVLGWTAGNALSQQSQTAASLNGLDTWHRLADGLEKAIFVAPIASEAGTSLIHIFRIDPAFFEFKLLNASAQEDGQPLTAKQWCQQHGLVAAINASMYQTDYRSSVSLMRTRGHINNPRLSKDMAVLAFDRRNSRVPPVKIIDRQCDDFLDLKKHYHTLVQSIRMISCTGQNVWRQQPQKWSTAAIGTDSDDRVLFIHVPSLYSTHDLINILLSLPLQISRAMYVEGGPEAQLYVRVGESEFEYTGSHFSPDGKSFLSRPIPNVIGIVERRSESE
jgi:hypothetical protein